MSYILFVGDLFWGKSSNHHRKIGCPPAVQCDEVLKVQRMLLSARWTGRVNRTSKMSSDVVMKTACGILQRILFFLLNAFWSSDALLSGKIIHCSTGMANCVLDLRWNSPHKIVGPHEGFSDLLGASFCRFLSGIEIGYACICPSPSNNHAKHWKMASLEGRSSKNVSKKMATWRHWTMVSF